MNYQDEYKANKRAVIEALEKTSGFLESIGDVERPEACRRLAESVENGTFSIVVVGQFSAGKSTFLNALMGEKYLPSFKSETTATINFLRSPNECDEKKPMIYVNYRDGHQEKCSEVTLENIEKYVSTKGDEVAKKILSVEVFLDSQFLNDGVSLVDSPGLNGVLEGHEQLTNEQIDRSHAAIFMFNAHQPGSKTDFEIFKLLNDRCQSLFVILNQIDLIKSEEQTIESVIDDLKAKYAEYFPGSTIPEIYPVSSYKALVARNSTPLTFNDRKDFSEEEKARMLQESGIDVFENRLYKYLTQGEKAHQELISPVQKAIAFINEAVANLQEDITSLSNEDSALELEAKVDSLETELNELTASIRKDIISADTKIDTIISDCRDAIKTDIRRIGDESKASIDSEDDIEAISENSVYYINAMNKKCFSVIESHVNEAKSSFKSMVRTSVSELTDDIQSRINDGVSRKLNAEHENVNINQDIFNVDIKIDEYFDVINKYRDAIEDLEDQYDQAEADIDRSASDKAKRDDIKEQLERVRLNRQEDLADLGSRPVAYNEDVRRKKSGRGFLKAAWQYLFGESYETVTERNDSLGKLWDNKVTRIKDEYQQQIDELQRKYDATPTSDYLEMEKRAQRIQKRKERMEEKLAAAEAEKKAYIKGQVEKKTKKAKNYLLTLFDDEQSTFLKEVDMDLSLLEKDMHDTARYVIESGVSLPLKRKKEDLLGRLAQAQKSAQEKDELINVKRGNISSAKEILNTIQGLEKTLSEQTIDTIKIEQL